MEEFRYKQVRKFERFEILQRQHVTLVRVQSCLKLRQIQKDCNVLKTIHPNAVLSLVILIWEDFCESYLFFLKSSVTLMITTDQGRQKIRTSLYFMSYNKPLFWRGHKIYTHWTEKPKYKILKRQEYAHTYLAYILQTCRKWAESLIS